MVRSGWVSFLGLSLSFVLIAGPLGAQEEKKGSGRRGGPGAARAGAPADIGESKLVLLRREQVQTEVKITPEQKTEIEKIGKDLRDQQTALGRTGNASAEDREKAIEKRKQLMAEAEQKLASVLKPEQVKRLNEISFQLRGTQALKDEAIAKELKLSTEQVTKIGEAIQWGQDERRKLAQESRNSGKRGATAERMEKMEKIKQEADTKVLAVLTAPQKEQYEKMRGAPFKLDTSGAGQRRGQGKAGEKGGEKGATGGSSGEKKA